MHASFNSEIAIRESAFGNGAKLYLTEAKYGKGKLSPPVHHLTCFQQGGAAEN